MERIVNYLDIPEEKRDAAVAMLGSLSFYFRDGLDAFKASLNQSRRDSLPQYLFVFRDETLIGYSFVYGETAPSQIGGSGTSNADELPLPLAVRLLEETIALEEKHGCHGLVKVTRMVLENQKKGLGRRPDPDCR